MSPRSVEMGPEIEQWLGSLNAKQFACAGFELRFDVDRTAMRFTYFFPGDRRVVLLTVFRKQRQNERAEVERARRAMATCVERGHTADEED
jgi:hypothetical protein